MGCLLKSYFPKKHGVDSALLYHVSIMPCLDKRAEARRVTCAEVDLVLTTEEFLEAMRMAGMDERLRAMTMVTEIDRVAVGGRKQEEAEGGNRWLAESGGSLATAASFLSNFNSESQKVCASF
jgi:iron only hydrogenase large subunit-like protein